MSKIRWNTEEINIVVTKARELIKLDPRLSELNAVRRAQKELPKNRQREIKQKQQIERVLAQIFFDNANESAVNETIKESKSTCTLDVKSFVETNSVFEILTNVPLIEIFNFLFIKGVDYLNAFALRQENLEATTKALKGNVDAFLSNLLSAPTKEEISEPAQNKKPKIVIFGLLGDQVNVLRSKKFLTSQVDLVFIDKGKFPDTIPYADHYVILAKFMPHDAIKTIKSKLSSTVTKVIEYHGGLTKLVDIIILLINKQPVPHYKRGS